MSTSLRKAIYGVVAAVGVLLVALHAVPVGLDTQWLPVIDAALGVIAMGIAALKAKRFDFKVGYSAVSAVLTALAMTGVVNPELLTSIDGLIFQLSILGPLVSFFRTDTSTPTGQPATEYDAEVAPL